MKDLLHFWEKVKLCRFPVLFFLKRLYPFFSRLKSEKKTLALVSNFFVDFYWMNIVLHFPFQLVKTQIISWLLQQYLAFFALWHLLNNIAPQLVFKHSHDLIVLLLFNFIFILYWFIRVPFRSYNGDNIFDIFER